jgi:hypothetical protein
LSRAVSEAWPWQQRFKRFVNYCDLRQILM